MTVFVGDILNATPATVVANPPSTRTWRWLRNGVAIPGFTSTSYRVTGLDTGAPIAAQQVETNLMGSSSATSVNTANVGAWTPSTIFSAAEPGVWYDTDDYAAMFQDSAGTTPITGAGQPVGLLLDKSKGLILGPELVTNGGFTTDTDWNKGTGWAITGGTAVATAVPSGQSISQAIGSIVAGRSYRLTLEISSISGGIRPYAGTGGSFGTTVSTAGTYSWTLLAGGTGGIYIATAGTTNATVDNISVKELPGNHATSSGDARPTTVIRPLNAERRNLLTRTEEFNNAVWTRVGATVPVTNNTAPDGAATADTLMEQVSGGEHFAYQQLSKAAASLTYTYTAYLKAGSGTRNFALGITDGITGGYAAIFSTSGGVVASSQAVGSVTGWTFISSSISSDLGGGWYRATLTATTNTATRVDAVCYLVDGTTRSYTGNGTSSVVVWGAQLEQVSSATPYQRVVTTNEWYDPVVPSYRGIQFDGVDDFFVTPTITPGTDKAQIFAGVRKLSDAAAGMIAEFSAGISTNAGSFYLTAPDTSPTRYASASRGNASILVGHATTTTLGDAPDTAVITTTHDISGDLSTIRRNTVSGTSGTADKGSGIFLAYPLYIGRRGGSTLPYNGILTSLVVRFGPNLSTSNINRAEYYVSEKTGVTLT